MVGELAREQGARVPGRLVTSAKSWLANPRVDRTAPHPAVGRAGGRAAPLAGRGLGALPRATCATRGTTAARTRRSRTRRSCSPCPASFDEVARELTLAAAREAGLGRVTLVEEPQAAFYDWASRHRADLAAALGRRAARARGGRRRRHDRPHARRGRSCATGAPRSRGSRSATTSSSAATTWISRSRARSRRGSGSGSTRRASRRSCTPAASRRSGSWRRAGRSGSRSRSSGAGQPARRERRLGGADARGGAARRSSTASSRGRGRTSGRGARPRTAGLAELGLPYEPEPAITAPRRRVPRGARRRGGRAAGRARAARRDPRERRRVHAARGARAPRGDRVVAGSRARRRGAAREPGARPRGRPRRGVLRRWSGAASACASAAARPRAFYVGIAAPEGDRALCVVPRHLEEGTRVDGPAAVRARARPSGPLPAVRVRRARGLERPGDVVEAREDLVPLPPVETVLRGPRTGAAGRAGGGARAPRGGAHRDRHARALVRGDRSRRALEARVLAPRAPGERRGRRRAARWRQAPRQLEEARAQVELFYGKKAAVEKKRGEGALRAAREAARTARGLVRPRSSASCGRRCTPAARGGGGAPTTSGSGCSSPATACAPASARRSTRGAPPRRGARSARGCSTRPTPRAWAAWWVHVAAHRGRPRRGGAGAALRHGRAVRPAPRSAQAAAEACPA